MLKIQSKLNNAFLALLGLPATAVGFALSTQIATLSWILSNKYNLDIHDVSFVWLAGPVAGVFGQVIVGLVSDNVWFMGGRRRPFIVIGGMISTVAFLALPHIRGISHITGIADITIIASIIALFLDLSINVTFNPARSIIADLTPEGKVRTAGYVWMQIISGTFGVLAYFLSMVFGNILLLYIAAVIVFVTAVFPIFFIQENRYLNEEQEQVEKNQTKKKINVVKVLGWLTGIVSVVVIASLLNVTTIVVIAFVVALLVDMKLHPQKYKSFFEILVTIYPLYGFLIFGLFSLIYHFFPNELGFVHNPLLIISLAYSVIIGIINVIKGTKQTTDKNEFQKIMLAHSFSWVAFQSMFILSGFFVKEQLLPHIDMQSVGANWFAEKLTGVAQTTESTVGNIVSLGFLVLNLIGALFPMFLQSVAKRVGRVRTYITALIFSALGYFYIAFLSRSEMDFYIGMVLVGIGWSAVISIVFAIMSERVVAAKMGLYMGVFNLAVVLPQMMSNGVANVIKATGNHQLLYIFCGMFVCASVFFWLFVKEPQNQLSSDTEIPKMH